MRTTHVTFTHGYVMYTAELNGHLHGNMKEWLKGEATLPLQL
jgi:hypothetical protein